MYIPQLQSQPTATVYVRIYHSYKVNQLPLCTYGTRQKKVSGLSQYLPVLPQCFCRYFRGYVCWYFLYSTIEAHNAHEEVFHKKRAAVHTQLTSGFVDRCLYCCRATHQASALLCFTHRQFCTDRTRQRSRAYARVLSKYCERSRSSSQREQH